MSDVDIQPSAAEAIEAAAADWLMERRDRDDWNESDQAELDAWLAQSVSHRVAYIRLQATWGRTDRLAALRRPDIETAAAPRRFPRVLTAIAASIALAAVLGAIGMQFLAQPQERTYTTPLGGRELISFKDGSQIELNTDTVLRARMTTRGRTVWLEKGEAYFRIKHDPANPFVVIAGVRRITDLGTKFLIRRETGRLEVALLEGRVRFSAEGKQPQSALLTPGDEIIAAKDTSLTKKSVQDIANELGWRRGVLVFQHTTLAEAAAEFNRYNSQKIRIADEQAARRTIDGTFLINDLEAFTDAAQTIFGLRAETHGDSIVIAR